MSTINTTIAGLEFAQIGWVVPDIHASVKFLSATLSFFQSNCVFTHSNTPDLNRNIEKLTFEIVNQDLQNQSHLWGTLGGKYLPSILYKVRMVTIQEGNFEDDYTRVSGFSSIV